MNLSLAEISAVMAARQRKGTLVLTDEEITQINKSRNDAKIQASDAAIVGEIYETHFKNQIEEYLTTRTKYEDKFRIEVIDLAGANAEQLWTELKPTFTNMKEVIKPLTPGQVQLLKSLNWRLFTLLDYVDEHYLSDRLLESLREDS